MDYAVLPHNFSEKDEDGAADIFYAVGLGLCRWSQVEARLYTLFSSLLYPPNEADGTDPQMEPWLASRAALDAIVSLKAKVQAIQSAANVMVTDKALLYVLTKLLRKVMAQSIRRNELAHFQIVKDNNKNRMLLVPYFQIGVKPLEKLIDLKKGRTYQDIMEASSAFMDLASSLQWLNFHINGPPNFPAELLLEPSNGPIRRILPHSGMISNTPQHPA